MLEVHKGREMECLLIELIETFPTAIIVHDFDGKLLYVNQKTLALHGYGREEFLQLNIKELSTPESESLIRPRMGDIRKRGESSFEVEHFRKDGAKISLLVNATIAKWGGKDVVLNTAIDLTPQKKVEQEKNTLFLENMIKRERAEAALLTSEEKYHHLIQNIPDVIWTSDEYGNTPYISESVTKTFGFTPEEIMANQRQWFERIHKDDRERVQNAYDELVKFDRLFDIEYRLQRKDDTWIWVHDRASKVYRKDNIRYVDGIFRDVTRRKRVEEALRKSEAIYRSLFENSIIGIVVTGPDFKFQQVNAAFCKMLEYSEEEIVGRKGIADLTHTRDLPESEELLDKLMRKELDHFVVEKRYIAKSGRIINSLNFSRGIYDLSGTYLGETASILDITDRKLMEEELRNHRDNLEDMVKDRSCEIEAKNKTLTEEIAERKRVEEALRASAESYRLLFDKASDIIMVMDVTGRIVNISPSVTDILEYNPKDFEGRLFWESPGFTPEYATKIKDIFFKNNLEETSTPTYYELRNKSGRPIYLEVMSKLVLKNNEPTFKVVFARDVTTRKMEEEKLKQIEQEQQDLLEKTLQISDLKSNIITQAAHELKTPLTAIQGWGELLYNAKKQGKSLDAMFDLEDIEIIIRNAERLNDLINDFLDVGRIDDGKFVINKQESEFREIIENALDAVNYLANQKGTEINASMAPGFHLAVDPRRMEQVIINLLSNAIKYSPEHTHVSIATSVKEIETRKIFQIKVSDEGYGFTPEELANAMKSFGKAYTRQEQKRSIQGTGLGLFISQRIIEQHGGTLVIRSEGVNKGTQVEVQLPLD